MLRLFRHTLAALALPRRALPIALVTAALASAQWWFTRTAAATGLSLGMALLFVLTAPAAWRALFPTGQATTAPRLLAYLGVAALPPALGALASGPMGLGGSFLTVGINIAVIAALAAVGGWGLGRDIEMEAGLEAALARAEALARQAEQAELLALRASLDPHFLFNTLNAIAEWTREDPLVAEAALLRLSELLRELMAGVRAPTWPLARELSVARAVWELHAIRDPERFRHSWELPEPLPAVQVPPLFLLPLVENAVKHGPAAGHDGLLRLVLAPGTPLCLRIENPGPYSGARDGGEGLSLARRRLALVLPAARLDIRGEAGRTVVEVHLEAPP